MQANNGIDARSKQLRKTIAEMIHRGGRGHVGSAFSLVEICRVLYDEVMRYDSSQPDWKDRDRFILSKGHGCLALYPLLAEKGFFPQEELWDFCKPESILGGHPEHKAPGVEASTGSLGHGLSIGVGMALNARYEKSDYRTFVIVGDGESNEGSIWEAAMCAAKHKLSNLTVIVDYNKQQSYDKTSEVLDLEPFSAKWKAFGCAVAEIDGHSLEELREVFGRLPLDSAKPSVIIAHTVKGKGISFVEENLKWHHKNKITDEEISAIYQELDD